MHRTGQPLHNSDRMVQVGKQVSKFRLNKATLPLSKGPRTPRQSAIQGRAVEGTTHGYTVDLPHHHQQQQQQLQQQQQVSLYIINTKMVELNLIPSSDCPDIVSRSEWGAREPTDVTNLAEPVSLLHFGHTFSHGILFLFILKVPNQ